MSGNQGLKDPLGCGLEPAGIVKGSGCQQRPFERREQEPGGHIRGPFEPELPRLSPFFQQLRKPVLVGREEPPDRLSHGVRQGLLLDREHGPQAHPVVTTDRAGLKELDESLQPAPRVLFRGVELSEVPGEHLPFILRSPLVGK